MLNRARVQPDPATFFGLAADIMQSVATSSSLDEAFLRMEEAGVMLRIDRSVTPTMAKSPTLAEWELELLRTVEDVVRRGHVRRSPAVVWTSTTARSASPTTRSSCTAPPTA